MEALVYDPNSAAILSLVAVLVLLGLAAAYNDEGSPIPSFPVVAAMILSFLCAIVAGISLARVILGLPVWVAVISWMVSGVTWFLLVRQSFNVDSRRDITHFAVYIDAALVMVVTALVPASVFALWLIGFRF